MTQDQLLILLFRITLIAGAVSAALFIVVYSLLAPWWRDPIGRTIVILDGLIGAAFIPSILSLFFNFNRLTSYIAAWFDVTDFTAITFMLLHRSWLWTRLHRQRGEEEPAVYITPPDHITPAQLRELQDALNRLGSEHPGRFVILPPGSKVSGPELAVTQFQSGIITIDELREKLNLPPWDGTAPPKEEP